MAETVYSIVTERITQLLERGVCPWRRPWRSTLAQNLVSRRAYQGLNSLVLNALAYEAPYWLTFKQARDLGGAVRRGEHGTPVIFWKLLEREGEKGRESFPVLRYFTVFNVTQCDGLGGRVPAVPDVRATVEQGPVVAGYLGCQPGLALRHGGDRAFYRASDDSVTM